ncbi:MAG: sugar transferase [Bacteroidales bacterium]|nr:sugar transferase [Bacteroidales bacterium]
MNPFFQKLKYITSDILSAALAWSLLFSFRKYLGGIPIEEIWKNVTADAKFYLGITLVPSGWIFLYFFTGFYEKIFKRSRLKEMEKTLIQTTIGSLILFFMIILDDIVPNFTAYYKSFLFLFIVHFTLTYAGRLFITSQTIKKIRTGKWGFKTLLVGNNGNALHAYQEIVHQPLKSGNFFIGYVSLHENDDFLREYLPRLGTIDDLDLIMQKNEIDEVIIAVEPSEHALLSKILIVLESYPVEILIMPDYRDILIGTVKTDGIFYAPFIHVPAELMPAWQRIVKRAMDIVVSILAIVLLSPIFVITAILIKLTSKGPIIYSQERIGRYGKPFIMHKFRSMYVDAEKNGPALSSKNDPRITPLGRILRKYRIDELPQFFNVLIGNMSLVGPRPERKYYIDQILQRAPYYRLLLRIKPGITSWGQVKYGYAENVDQMIERLKYDILYLENMSLTMDIKIIIYTFLIILQGRGK